MNQFRCFMVQLAWFTESTWRWHDRLMFIVQGSKNAYNSSPDLHVNAFIRWLLPSPPSPLPAKKPCSYRILINCYLLFSFVFNPPADHFKLPFVQTIKLGSGLIKGIWGRTIEAVCKRSGFWCAISCVWTCICSKYSIWLTSSTGFHAWLSLYQPYMYTVNNGSLL